MAPLSSREGKRTDFRYLIHQKYHTYLYLINFFIEISLVYEMLQFDFSFQISLREIFELSSSVWKPVRVLNLKKPVLKMHLVWIYIEKDLYMHAFHGWKINKNENSSWDRLTYYTNLSVILQFESICKSFDPFFHQFKIVCSDWTGPIHNQHYIVEVIWKISAWYDYTQSSKYVLKDWVNA